MRNPEEVAGKMATAQGYSDVIFLRGGHLSCHFLRKGPRTCQSYFNDQNKNNCKGKMFWVTRSAAGFSGIVFQKCFEVLKIRTNLKILEKLIRLNSVCRSKMRLNPFRSFFDYFNVVTNFIFSKC